MNKQQSNNLKEWITAREAARILGMTDRRIRQLIQEGHLMARKKGNLWLIKRDSVYQYERT